MQSACCSTSGRGIVGAAGCSSLTRGRLVAPLLISRSPYRPQSGVCRAENQSKSNTDTTSERPAVSSLDEELVDRQVQKLSELRKEQQRGQSQTNIIQGALEEAQLITWPTPKKAFLDTVLVLGIVALSGSLLFGLNVLLAEGSNWWYHR